MIHENYTSNKGVITKKVHVKSKAIQFQKNSGLDIATFEEKTGYVPTHTRQY